LGLRNRDLFDESFGRGSPIAKVDRSVLLGWAQLDPDTRYPALASSISMFSKGATDVDKAGLSPLFMEILDRAPDKRAVLGDFWARIHPHGWSGSLADVLVARRAKLKVLETHDDPAVRQWLRDMEPVFDEWIERDRARDREREESFE
jgi:hypothetical protein